MQSSRSFHMGDTYVIRLLQWLRDGTTFFVLSMEAPTLYSQQQISPLRSTLSLRLLQYAYFWIDLDLIQLLTVVCKKNSAFWYIKKNVILIFHLF